MRKIFIFLLLICPFFTCAQNNKNVTDAKKIKNKKYDTLTSNKQTTYCNIAMYHYLLFNTKDKTHVDWLKKNDKAFYHLGYYLRYLDNNSLEWLKKYNKGFYYYSQMFLDVTDSFSSNWLKKNNIEIFHLCNYNMYNTSSSLKWLRENNIQLYHFANIYDDDTRQTSLLWLKEH